MTDKLYVRITCDGEGKPTTEEFLRTNCDRTLRAIELMCDWMKV